MKIKAVLLVLFLCCAGYAVAKEGSPEQQVELLFKQLASERRGTAFQEFFQGSLVASQKEAFVKVMDAQARTAWEVYGSPTSYEIVERREIGKSLFRIRWITKHKDEAPLFWSVLFYLRVGSWEPLTAQFFDDPSKAGL